MQRLQNEHSFYTVSKEKSQERRTSSLGTTQYGETTTSRLRTIKQLAHSDTRTLSGVLTIIGVKMNRFENLKEDLSYYFGRPIYNLFMFQYYWKHFNLVFKSWLFWMAIPDSDNARRHWTGKPYSFEEYGDKWPKHHNWSFFKSGEEVARNFWIALNEGQCEIYEELMDN